MGVEYYIIKPRTKEMFYLGKGQWYWLEDMPIRNPRIPMYETYDEVLVDIIQTGCYVEDDTMKYMVTLANAIFQFVNGAEVQLVSDCDSDTPWLNTYKEVGDIQAISREVYGG